MDRWREASQKEGTESPEVFRASLGFDFIFHPGADGKKHCSCIEINGDDTGIAGIADLPKGEIAHLRRVFAAIRDRRNPRRKEKAEAANSIIDDMETGDFPVSLEAGRKIHVFLRRSVNGIPMMVHAFRNSEYIQNITTNKQRQSAFIPQEHTPRVYRPGESPISPTGCWVLKPNGSRAGIGVKIISNSDLERRLQDPETLLRYAIQEFVRPLGAEKAPESLKRNPASMRLMIDFRYLQDGTIEPVFEIAYQRVSQLSPEKHARRRTMSDIFIVNRHQGAKSVAASQDEIDMARPIALEIIHRIARGYIEQLQK